MGLKLLRVLVGLAIGIAIAIAGARVQSHLNSLTTQSTQPQIHP
jgi:hypothetical protein